MEPLDWNQVSVWREWAVVHHCWVSACCEEGTRKVKYALALKLILLEDKLALVHLEM